MHCKRQNKFKRLGLIGIVLLSGFLLEPTLRQKVTFAVNYFDSSKVDYQQKLPASMATSATTETAANPKPRKSHAPEPSTLLLFLSGIGGMLVRFARSSFEKFKRFMDICLSALGLMITSPVLIFTAILIKLTSQGPVIYKQKRVGRRGEIFEIYKLRTMCVDAEKNTGAIWAKKNDSRVTTVGRLLRKAHIDEIPQLLNVIKGEMSIVGPRPERPEMVRDFQELIRDYGKRLQIKPGITGLAQVWHKYDETIEDVKKKVKYDLLYIKRMCLLTDLRIMANTFVVVFSGRGAR